MQSRIYYLYLRLLVKIQLFFQAIFGFISSSHKNDHKSDVKQSLVSIYLGNKVFSNYSIRPGDDVSFINISALKNRRFDDSIFILSNNDFSDESSFLVVSEIKKNSSNLQVLIWDFDNHHSLVNSMRLLYLSDFYFAAHLHNFEFLRRASSSYFGILPAAVIQWSKDFLLKSMNSLLSVPRSNELFGSHVYYPTFSNRNRIIGSVSKNFPRVGFSNLTYHNRSNEDRFVEWCHYKVHFIVPVDNDLPIRLLDALVTGGIPLVPIKMKSLLHTLSLDRFVVFYDEVDLDRLRLKVELAIFKFDQFGPEGMLERINYVLDRHHTDSRIDFLINFRH